MVQASAQNAESGFRLMRPDNSRICLMLVIKLRNGSWIALTMGNTKYCIQK